MTDQERQLLEELAGRVRRAPAPQVDRDADDLIRREIGSRPDALYILTQTVLLQELALNQSKQQIEELKRQQQTSDPPQSFLGNTRQPVNQPPSGYRASTYQTGYTPPPAQPAPPPLPQYAQQPQYAQPDYAPQPSGGRFSGFLRNAAQTAAGVVAGEVAFSAISSLFGHHDSYYGGGGGGFFGGGSGISPVSETIITNNYYGDDRERGHEYSSRDDDYGNREPVSADPVSNDSSDYDNTSDYEDTSVADDDTSYDDGSDSVDV